MADLSALIDIIDAVDGDEDAWRPRSKLKEVRELLSTRFDQMENTGIIAKRLHRRSDVTAIRVTPVEENLTGRPLRGWTSIRR